MTNATTFFSYKGGSGRSTTCLNTLPFLADYLGAYSGTPILLLDMDIESAGMTYLLNQQDFFRGDVFDVKELLKSDRRFSTERVQDISKHELLSKFVPVGKRLGLDDDYAVRFLGVNDQSPQINKQNIGALAERSIGDLHAFSSNNGIKAIIMDSAAGDQDSATTAIGISDKVVFCMRPTKQFRVGTFNYLTRLKNRLGSSGEDIEIILLPTVVPADANINGISQLNASISDIEDRISRLGGLNVNDTFVCSSKTFGINEVARFKWQEEILFKLKASGTDLVTDENIAYQRYMKLAEIIGE